MKMQRSEIDRRSRSRRGETVWENVVHLRAGQVWHGAVRPREVAIECHRGSLWVTQEGDWRDVVLKAGERFVNTVRGRVVALAMTAAVVRVTRLVRRFWSKAVVATAMASAFPLAGYFEISAPGMGVMLAISFGLFAQLFCAEIRR